MNSGASRLALPVALAYTLVIGYASLHPFEGWRTPTDKARTWKQLPARARSYLKAIAQLTGAELTIASVGPARAQTIML